MGILVGIALPTAAASGTTSPVLELTYLLLCCSLSGGGGGMPKGREGGHRCIVM